MEWHSRPQNDGNGNPLLTRRYMSGPVSERRGAGSTTKQQLLLPFISLWLTAGINAAAVEIVEV